MGKIRRWVELGALKEVGLEKQLVFFWVTKQKEWWQLTGIRSLSQAEADSTWVAGGVPVWHSVKRRRHFPSSALRNCYFLFGRAVGLS